jgi:NAD(P) transhydrogenase subunit alpha
MDTFIAGLTVFVLALFAGFEVITKVPPTLHTPLMSGANAISGITIVGALLAAGSERDWFLSALGFVAVVFATINTAWEAARRSSWPVSASWSSETRRFPRSVISP